MRMLQALVWSLGRSGMGGAGRQFVVSYTLTRSPPPSHLVLYRGVCLKRDVRLSAFGYQVFEPGVYTLGELPKLKKMYSVFAPVFDVIEFPDAVLGTFVQKGECQLKVRIGKKKRA